MMTKIFREGKRKKSCCTSWEEMEECEYSNVGNEKSLAQIFTQSQLDASNSPGEHLIKHPCVKLRFALLVGIVQ